MRGGIKAAAYLKLDASILGVEHGVADGQVGLYNAALVVCLAAADCHNLCTAA